MGEYKTPGVYIKEKNAFGNSIVEAETAIPAFIGFTEKALNGDDDLTNIPWKISSMNEYIQYFGGAPALSLKVEVKKIHHLTQQLMKEKKKLPDETADGLFIYIDHSHEYTEKMALESDQETTSSESNTDQSDVPYNYAFCISGKHPYSLYYQMQMFFANGGGTCYVVSVGTYEEKKDAIDDNLMKNALGVLEKEREVTMIVVPEAVENKELCGNIQQLMMKHCGEMANRFAILDVPQGDKSLQLDKRMENFQNTVTNYFSYGAAYFPWLNTTVLSDKNLSGDMFEWDKSVWTNMEHLEKMDASMTAILKTFTPTEVLELKKADNEKEKGKKVSFPNDENLSHTFTFGEYSGDIQSIPKDKLLFDFEENGKKVTCKVIDVQQTKDNETVTAVTLTIVWYSKENLPDKNNFHLILYNGSPLYKQAIKGVLKQLNLLPPSAAMAGIYTMVDHTRGVWKAPANVSLNYVDSPAEDLDDDEQANLNAPMTGKAINVIRMFRGEGVKVWGARTLDGNSLDWRYINVRRTLLFLEESVKNAARAYVFEPNDSGTWINMKSMIENFLRSVWKRGGLAGATPEDAYKVHVGLGDTMTADDILEGIMRITVLVAVTHPAEFIEITFQQQMQKS